MSAHWRPFKTQCEQRGCVSRATAEVFNTYNASQGVFCRHHADQRVKELQAGERWLTTAAPAEDAPRG